MIWITYGDAPARMSREIMEQAQVQKALRPDMHVVIKPNLVNASKAEEGATTHPEIVEGIIQFLQAQGIQRISIAEGAWVGEKQTAFACCGYEVLRARYGVTLLDTKRDACETRTVAGRSYEICKSVLDADYLINVPVLKGHCQTRLTCCMKNLKGCIPDREKRRYHTLGLSQPIADLNLLLKPDLHIVDSICGDLTFEEGGNPVQADRILLGTDALELDAYCAELIGYAPEEVGYLRILMDQLGAPVPVIRELHPEHRPSHVPSASPVARRLAAYTEADSACSACYAALIFALDKVAPRGLKEPIKIGQGFRGRRLDGYGVGSCTQGCRHHVPGCPPTAAAITQFLEAILLGTRS